VYGAISRKSQILFTVGTISILTMQPAQADTEFRIQDIIHHPTSAALLAQARVTVVQVTGVQVNPTDKGVEVILQTPLGEQLQITNCSADNSFIADIPNAQLRLPSGNDYIPCGKTNYGNY
jgi:iron complex outermembrane receptor protein